MGHVASPLLAITLCLSALGGCDTPRAHAADEPLAAPAQVAPTSKATTVAPTTTLTAASTSSILLSRFELAEAVEAREPIGVATRFVSGTKIYAFLELKNKGGPAGAVFVRFEREGAKAGRGFRLDVPGTPRHRTFASTNNSKQPGSYRCVVTSEDDKVLAEKSFEIVAAAPSE